MFVEIFFCVVLIFVAIWCNEETKNTKKRNEILELAKQEKELNLNRVKERQKYVNVILNFEKEDKNG
ncbi:MAG: hypothetical protein IKV94_03520 [Clostridia bacterium]|nr:hypothetical protein [Clostridia bacterium]